MTNISVKALSQMSSVHFPDSFYSHSLALKFFQFIETLVFSLPDLYSFHSFPLVFSSLWFTFVPPCVSAEMSLPTGSFPLTPPSWVGWGALLCVLMAFITLMCVCKCLCWELLEGSTRLSCGTLSCKHSVSAHRRIVLDILFRGDK